MLAKMFLNVSLSLLPAIDLFFALFSYVLQVTVIVLATDTTQMHLPAQTVLLRRPSARDLN